jgi:N utilization substance protein B
MADKSLSKRLARLQAVQALYQMELSGMTAQEALLRRPDQKAPEMDLGEDLPPADPKLLQELVEGVAREGERVDDLLMAVLDEAWPVERLELLLRVILRAGAYELSNRLDIPAKVTLAQYVDLVHAFYDDREVGLANGVLDRLARGLRPDEL